MKKWYVVIKENENTARLECASLEEAQRVKVSFENWRGGLLDISIECVEGIESEQI